MSASTNIASGSLTTFVIKVGGTIIPDEFRVHAVHVEKEVNHIARAKVTLIDGDASTGDFKVSSSSTFVPGAKLAIEAGYDGKNAILFEGIITGHTIRIDQFSGSALIVECKDEAVKMIVGRKSLTYSKKTDSDIISSIIEKYSGLSKSVTTTKAEWPLQIQYYVTDWGYLLSRAEANGLIVTTINGKISVQKPDNDTTSVLTIEYGNNLVEFNAGLSAMSQLGSAKASSWDYKSQEIISAKSSDNHVGPGNLSSKTLSEVIGLSDYQMQTSANLEQTDLTNWTKAQLVKSDYSKIQGEVKFQGTSKVEPGKYITLKGVGDRFNGDHLVSRVIHDISDGNWITESSIGLSATWFTEEPDVMSPPAAGLLHGIRGLFNGTVKKIHEDPENQFRILVNVPLFDNNGGGIWARLSNFYSTSGAGAFFLPEVGDEVVMGCLNEDPRSIVILGSLYSSDKNKPFKGLEPDEKNTIKAFVSKSGINIEFDDENKVLTIATPGNNTAIFSDKDKQITFQDENENTIVMSESGIVMKSPKDISIEADQCITIKGMQGVTIESSGGDVSVSGINIKQSANVEYSAEGSASASVQGGGELTLKGAMVMIN